jgi:hypothetical protein
MPHSAMNHLYRRPRSGYALLIFPGCSNLVFDLVGTLCRAALSFFVASFFEEQERTV